MYRHYFKRAISVLLAVCGLIVCAVPMVIIAMAIKLIPIGLTSFLSL